MFSPKICNNPSASMRPEEDEGGGGDNRINLRFRRNGGSFDLKRVGGLFWMVVLLIGCTGLCHGLDVQFDDPSSGFFLRDASTISASVSTISTTNVANNDDLNIEDVDDKVKTVPTTSIVLGETKEDSTKTHLAQNYLGDILHSSSFTVLRSAQPVTITAQYGPFRSRQTVPTQYLVPDLSENPDLDGISGKLSDEKVSRQPGLITDFKPHQLDLSAHLVTKTISKDNPVLRVLFHTGQRHGVGLGSGRSRSDPIFRSSHSATICAVMSTTLERQPTLRHNSSTIIETQRTLSAICSPDGREGTCLGQLTLPALWWPSMTHSSAVGTDLTKAKQPKVNIKVSYSVYETKGQNCLGEQAARISIIPETPLGTVPLVFPARGYRQLAKDEIIHMLLPQAPVYPNSKIYVPVFLEQPSSSSERGPISALTIKCRAKGGFRLEGVEATSRLWTVRAEMNARGTVATVNAFKKNLETTQTTKTTLKEETEKTTTTSTTGDDVEGPHELFNWLFALDDRDYETWDKGRISWHVRYQRAAARTQRPVETPVAPDALMKDQPDLDMDKHQDDDELEILTEGDYFDKDRYRLGARLSIQKDYVQAVLPIAKHSEIMNLAVLTGRQISKPLKIFIVSHAGEIADVTLSSLCTSKDQSVLKVSSSCTSVYVDGSETRGALSAQIDVKYGQQVGKAQFTIWMPEMPVMVDVADSKLSQIKGWKIPSSDSSLSSQQQRDDSTTERHRRKASQSDKSNKTSDIESVTVQSNGFCSYRYQQTKVTIFAKFLAEDSDSGRREYFPSRGFELDVTELLIGRGLRVADSRIASLRGNILQGLAPGRTEVQVVSPITGQEIGIREIKVAKNKETIREMKVRVLTGLNLKVQTDQIGQRGRYSVQTAYSQVLTSKYQEGLLDIELLLSDDTTIPLREVSPSEYYLGVKSMEPKIIAFAPSQEARYPRVIAVSSGQGKLLRVSLELVDSCMETASSDVPLAVADADVFVKIQNQKSDPIINDWDSKKVDKNLDNNLSNIALQDDQSYYGKPVMSNGRYDASGTRTSSTSRDRFQNSRIHPHQMTPLEVGMYILLAVFCAAMAIFVASCFVYASKYRRQEYPLQTKSQSVQNAHDWVWLGKANSSKQSVEGGGSQARSSCHEGSEMNITTNPRPDDFVLEEQPQREPLVGTNSTSSRTRTRTMASGHLPPPGHPAHGAPPFQIAPEMIRYGPYQKSHRYHQQMLMHRPQRFLPAPPMQQRLSPVYQNNNLIMSNEERFELEQLQQKQMMLELAKQEEQCRMYPEELSMSRRRFNEANIIPNPMEDEDQLRPRSVCRSDIEQNTVRRPKIDTSTYTKKNPGLAYFDDEHDRGRLILPVGYPYYADTANQETETTVDTSPDVARQQHHHQQQQQQHYFEEEESHQPHHHQQHHRKRLDDLSPLDLLPDPSQMEMDPEAPLRQSPASALPPVSIEERDEERSGCESPQLSCRGEYVPLNPDIDRPSPPRQGAARVFENPFELSDEEAVPITPEKLSPSHVFESSSLEEELLQKSRQNESRPVFDSRTFVIKKTPSPTNSNQGFIFPGGQESKSPQSESAATWCKEVIEADDEDEKDKDEDEAAGGMDYDSLMAYFESLKESTA